jgi:hypothetical protein
MSGPLSRLQKFGGMCTPATFGAEVSCAPPPHAAVRTAAATSTQVLSRRRNRWAAGIAVSGMTRSLQDENNDYGLHGSARVTLVESSNSLVKHSIFPDLTGPLMGKTS